MDAIDRDYYRLLRNSIREAKRRGVDISAKIETIDADQIVPFSRAGGASEERIEALEQLLLDAVDRGQSWPERLALPVLLWNESESKYDVIDGNHRVHAALRADFGTIPAIVIDAAAYDWAVHDMALEGETWLEALALESKVMRENMDLERSGP